MCMNICSEIVPKMMCYVILHGTLGFFPYFNTSITVCVETLPKTNPIVSPIPSLSRLCCASVAQ